MRKCRRNGAKHWGKESTMVGGIEHVVSGGEGKVVVDGVHR